MVYGVYRLRLQGLLPHVEYIITEPLPNDVSQTTGEIRMLHSEGMCAYVCIYVYMCSY